MTARHALALPAAALAALLALSACGNGGGAPVGPAAAGTTPAATASLPAGAPFSPADVAFVQGMTPHHEQAVQMSDIVLGKDPTPEVADLARRIKAAQGPEIDQMERLLQEFGTGAGSGHGGAAGSGHGGSGGDAHGSDPDSGSSGGAGAGAHGMMSEQDMAALRSASGAQAQRLFLEGMVEHHRGAVRMAETELSEGRHPETLALARTIRADQQREIAEMEQLLRRR